MIRIAEPQSGGWSDRAAEWGGWAFQKARERPYLAAIVAAPAAVVAIPAIVTSATAVAVAGVGGLAMAGVGEALFAPDAKPMITLLNMEDARDMLDVHDQPLMRDTTYMRLPRGSSDRGIVKSSDFHTYVMSQKVAEIIAYMRAETRLKSLSIKIRSSDRKHAVVGGELETIAVGVGADMLKDDQRSISATYDERVRVPHLPDYVWISDFPEVIAATRNARHGTMSFAQSTDMSFGMTGSVAKFAKFKAEWLSTFVLEVDAVFA